MTRFKSALAKSALILTLAGGALAVTASAALADVACNRMGECWHVKDHYTTYPRTLGVIFHDEAWWGAHNHDRTVRVRKDRANDHGYYKNGRWHNF
jgi:hypothetical protein